MTLGESWVVEDEGYGQDGSSQDEEEEEQEEEQKEPAPLPRSTPSKRRARDGKAAPKSPDPEFVMPSLGNSIDGSRENLQTQTRRRNTKSSSERVQPRRQPTYDAADSGSPERVRRTQPSTRYTKPPSTPSQFSQPQRSHPAESFLDLAMGNVASIMSWIFDVLCGALRILKVPISYMLAIWLLFGLGLMVRNLITSHLQSNHVGRAVDSVIATTRWTSRVLDGLQEQPHNRGALSGFVNDYVVAPFQPRKFTEGVLLDQYITHAQKVEVEISRLIDEAQALLRILVDLENRLDDIHGISTQAGEDTKAAKDEILSSLWAMVGGYRGEISKVDRRLDLLRQVSSYRKDAFAHVSGTVLRLQAMRASLEDLRERVGSPEVSRGIGDIPLAVHIEYIQQGVERLQDQRQTVRKLENQHIREILDRPQMDGNTIEG
ncbi:hypothetical protein M7I_8112 [Glarea lozoyensis 74030]|uniref:Uncharacterized protein n=1 Tax=Glarea lozoyensis (strain ATCC 74030 / MF5533) TaxID=1104152 RepID=H0EZ50_GLAL7|nr:hypothetical protein M7I_8112 [Glarea lozoyensis 74030]